MADETTTTTTTPAAADGGANAQPADTAQTQQQTQQTETSQQTQATSPAAETKAQETPAKEDAPPVRTPEAVDPWDLLKTDDERTAEETERTASENAQYAAEAGFGDDAKLEDIPLGADPNGNPLAMDAEQQRELLPYLREAGVPADKAPGVVKAFAAHEAARIKAEIARDKADTAAIWRKTQETFGESLKQVLADAQRGALRLFPKDLWEEMRKVPALALDERLLRSLAAHGRSYRNDNGGPPPSPQKAPPQNGGLVFDLASFSEGTKG